MTSPRKRLSTDDLREAARLRVAATSLRRTADEIGLSPTGLQGFLSGSEPYAPTIQKLCEWYVREEAHKPIPLSPETAEAAISLLVRHLPEPHRVEAVRRILEILAQEGTGAIPPEWIELLRGDEEPPRGRGKKK